MKAPAEIPTAPLVEFEHARPQLVAEEVPSGKLTGLARRLLAQVAQESEDWTIAQHQIFINAFSRLVGNAVLSQPSFVLPENLPPDPVSFAASDILACGDEPELFDRVQEEPDPEHGEEEDIESIEEFRQLCIVCAVKEACLERALSSPINEYGVWGGQTREERQAAWHERADARQKLLQEFYKNLSSELVLQPYENRKPQHNILINSLENLSKRLFPKPPEPKAPEKKKEVPPPPPYREIAEIITNNPVIAERLQLLLARLPRAVLAQWITASKSDEELIYDYKLLRRQSDRQNVSLRDIAPAEEAIISVVRDLVDGTFDYRVWFNRYISQCEKSALLLLDRMGTPIPPEATVVQLRELALEKLSVCKDLGIITQRAQDILTDYYNLRGSGTSTLAEMSERYDHIKPKNLNDYIAKAARQIAQHVAAPDAGIDKDEIIEAPAAEQALPEYEGEDLVSIHTLKI